MQSQLTCHLHNVSWDYVSGFDPLDSLAVHTIHLPHLRFVLFQSLDGVLCITFLSRDKENKEGRRKFKKRINMDFYWYYWCFYIYLLKDYIAKTNTKQKHFCKRVSLNS